MTCLVGSMGKGSFWLQNSKLLSKFSFKFLFPGIKMIAPVLAFKNEVSQR